LIGSGLLTSLRTLLRGDAEIRGWLRDPFEFEAELFPLELDLGLDFFSLELFLADDLTTPLA